MRKQLWGMAFLSLAGCATGESSFSSSPNITEAPPTSEAVPIPLPFGSQPELPGAVFNAARAPKPVSGGTLLVMKGDQTAIVSDPDRDQVLVVDLAEAKLQKTLTLAEDSEPGRAADDSQGHVHVALRGSGQLLSFDAASGEVLGTREVCAYPRGVAVSPNEGLVHVACAEGRLVTLSTDPSVQAPVRSVTLPRDLRDVVVASDGLWVSRFRSAEVLRLDAKGNVVRTIQLPGLKSELGPSVASVAWRMVAGASGGVVVVHQRAFAGEVEPSPGGYGDAGTSGGIVSSAVTLVDDSGEASGSDAVLVAPLAVDVAQSPVTGNVLLASAAAQHPLQPSPIRRTLLLAPSALGLSPAPTNVTGFAESDLVPQSGQLVAVAFAGAVPVMQYREPNSLVIGDRGITLPGESLQDTGSTLFHLETGSGLACESCHPEGQEDGRVWHFAGFGPRRTQSLRGGILGSEPFHWDGQESSFDALSQDVMQGRMAGPPLTEPQIDALAHYVDRFKAMPAPSGADPASIARGKALFEDPNVGCATCHSGARLTDNQTVFVGGDDGPMQVPSLIGLWARAPYLHDGCAGSLLERFTRCDSDQHGRAQGLDSDQLGALVTYLDSL
jgi:hypothetical protein